MLTNVLDIDGKVIFHYSYDNTMSKNSNVLDDITMCLGCARKLQNKLIGVANYCCQECTNDNPCKKPPCATKICKKHGTTIVNDPEDGPYCSQCEGEIWENEAKYAIKDLKCPACLRPVKVEEFDEGYVAFRCEYVYDVDGNFAKQPCPIFRIQLCGECNKASCICQEYDDREPPGV